MNIRHYILTLIFAAVSIAAGAQGSSASDIYIGVNGINASNKANLDSINKGVETVAVDNIKFTEPNVGVYNSQGRDISTDYDIRYFIQKNDGTDWDTIPKDNVVHSGSTVPVSYDKDNDWYVQYNDGNFVTGFYAGTATIHIVATNKINKSQTCEGWYQVKVTTLPVTLTIYPKEITVYKNFKFQLPTSELTYGSTNIEQYFNANARTVPSELADANVGDPEICTASQAGNYLIKWDYKGATIDGKDYSRHFNSIKDSVKVTVLDEEAPADNKPAVTLGWSGDAVSQTVARNSDGTFNGVEAKLPNPGTVTTTITTTAKDSKGKDVKTNHSILLTNLFLFKYEIESIIKSDGTTITSGFDDYATLSHSNDYTSWTLTPKALCTVNLKVTNMDKNLKDDGQLQAPTDYGQASLNYVVYVVDQTVNVTVTPDKVNIPGSWEITDLVWNLPEYNATLSGAPLTDVTWFFGLPDGTETNLNNDPDLAGGEVKTIDGVKYQLYPILRAFKSDDKIDLTKAKAKQFIFWAKPNDESLGEGGYGIQSLTQINKLTPVVKSTYNDIVANISSTDNQNWTMKNLHTPNVTITSSTGLDISSYYNVTYHLDKDAAAAGFSIDKTTGQVSYSFTGTEPIVSDRNITYVANPKSSTSIYGADSTTVTIHVSKSNFDYEVITTEGDNYGKFHFTGAGTMGSGTRINAVPGLDIRFGKVGDGSTWNITEAASGTDETDGKSSDSKVLFASAGDVTVGADNIPTTGTYYTLIPYTSGLVTIDADFEDGATYRLISEDKSYDKTYVCTTSGRSSYQWQTVLVGGTTYYLYKDGGELKLHGINYTPGYIESQNDATLTTKATTFVNGFSGTNFEIISSPVPGVSFGFAKDGIDYTAYASVDANSGVITAKRNSRGLGEDNRVHIVATVANDELGDAMVKTAEIRLLISAVPSYVVANGQAFAPGTELHPSVTENGITTTNTDVTLTIGGWDEPYDRSGKPYTDRFREAAFDESGLNGGIVDGFRYRSFGANDTYDENIKTFDRTVSQGQHSSFQLPTYGTYLKVEAKKAGTVMVYLCHNGIIDYVGENLETIKNGQPQMTQAKWRPVFITDETGNLIQLGSDAIASTDEDPENPGVYTSSTLKVAYNDSRVRNYAINNPYASSEPAQFLSAFTTDDKYKDCSFSWYRFGTAKTGLKDDYILEDAKRIVDAWEKMKVGERQKPIRLQQGFCFISKAYVRYTFRVFPGKSYFIWMAGSKPGLAGFSYIPDEYLSDATTANKSFDMTDDQSASSFYNTVAYGGTLTEDINKYGMNGKLRLYHSFDVTIKRKFGTDKWTSICLPFSVSEEKFAETFGRNALIMTYDSITPIKGSNDRFVVHLTQHAKKMIEANRPYFIRPSKTMSDDAKVGVTINGVTIQDDYGKLPSANGEQSSDGSLVISDQKNSSDVVNASGHTQVGTLTTVTAPAKSFIMAGTRLYHTTKEYSVPPFRSFIMPNNADASSGAKPATFETEIYDIASQHYLDIDDTPTGIEGIEEDGINDNSQHQHIVHGVFNLQGQKVAESIADRLPRGVYIVEGKKVIVR